MTLSDPLRHRSAGSALTAVCERVGAPIDVPDWKFAAVL